MIDLLEQFSRLGWLLHRLNEQNRRQYGPMGDPHRGQGRILSLLKMKPEISQKDLSYLLDMRPQSLGELLVKLEKNGYITRTPSEADRRVMNIKLTEEGAQTAEKRFNTDKLFDCLSQEEQDTLGGYLKRVIETLEQQLEEAAIWEQEGPEHPHHGRMHDLRRGHPGFPPHVDPEGQFDHPPFSRDDPRMDRRPHPFRRDMPEPDFDGIYESFDGKNFPSDDRRISGGRKWRPGAWKSGEIGPENPEPNTAKEQE